MDLYWAIALVITNLVWGAFAIYLIHLHTKDTKELRDRLMSRDFREFKYYNEELPEYINERRDELKDKKKREKKEKPLTQEEREIKDISEKF